MNIFPRSIFSYFPGKRTKITSLDPFICRQLQKLGQGGHYPGTQGEVREREKGQNSQQKVREFEKKESQGKVGEFYESRSFTLSFDLNLSS